MDRRLESMPLRRLGKSGCPKPLNNIDTQSLLDDHFWLLEKQVTLDQVFSSGYQTMSYTSSLSKTV